jgi:hypothetical protein
VEKFNILHGYSAGPSAGLSPGFACKRAKSSAFLITLTGKIDSVSHAKYSSYTQPGAAKG